VLVHCGLTAAAVAAALGVGWLLDPVFQTYAPDLLFLSLLRSWWWDDLGGVGLG
jgi:hypothetical protein